VTLAEAEAATQQTGAGEPLVSFVLPAYNEQDRLPTGLETVIGFLAEQPFESEIVVADDGSRDRTPDIVRERAAAGLPKHVALRLVQHAPNQGKGAAIRMGILAACGRFVFFMDADLATPPEESLKLLERLEHGATVVAGSRIQPDGSDMRASQPAQRRAVGRLFTFMRKAMRVLPDVDDTQCPLKGFDREAARAIFQRQQLRGWIFDAEVLQIARSLGYTIEMVPVRWAHVDGSRLRVRPQQAWEILRDLFRLRFLHPARRRK
jgi:dolichyl-phosphate beta-glucosyltransferase